MAKWRIMNILLLFIHSTTGQGPAAPPTHVAMEIHFINGAPNITGKWNAPSIIPNMSGVIERYLLVVTVNGTTSFNTTVSASTTSVNIFETFPSISQRRYTTYSLRVASISSVGRSYLTDPVSIVSNLIQSASVTAGVRKIIASCNIANSVPKALCTAVISNNTDRHVYTFQVGEDLIMLDYPTGVYNVSIRAHILGNLVVTEESSIWSISVPSVTITSSLSPTMALSSTLAISSSSTTLSSLPSSTTLPSLPSFTTSSLPSETSPLLPTPFTASDGNEDKDGEDDDKESNEASVGAVLVTVLVCTMMLSFTIIFTTILLIWWRHHTKRKDAPNATPIKASEKPCIKPTVNIEIDDSPMYEELDTIRDERYSVAVISTKSRINSALTSNHSSYIEMHPSASINDFGKSVIMQSNPSYHAVAITNT